MNRAAKTLALLLTLLALGAVALPAWAQRPARPAAESAGQPLPEWDQLSPAQRDAMIAVLRDRWNADPRGRARMLRHAERWSELTPEQRRGARHGRDRLEQMTPEERAKARAAYERMRAMSPEDRRALRETLRQMTPEERAEWFRREAERKD